MIELLVVVAIIALLVAILIPALEEAKATAQRVVCQSNMHHVGLAVGIYASQYNRSLPPYVSEDFDYIAWPWKTYLAYDVDFGPPTATDHGTFNLATLQENELVTAEALYCPAQTFSDHQWETHENIWGKSADLRPGNKVRTAYQYNPHVVDPTSGAGSPPPDRLRKYKYQDEFPLDEAMLVDVLYETRAAAHARWMGWNLLMGDCSVKFAQSETVYNELLDHEANGTIALVGASWLIYSPLLEALEDE